MRIFFIAILLSISNIAFALTIPKGKFYFDNSLTQYSVVKFVYGSDSNAETYVASMKVGNNGYWEITFDHAIENMYRYTFAETSLPDGKIADTFSNVKEHISKTLVENRTATTSQAILVGGVYTPATGDNWAQGSWKMLSGSTTNYSGTLPVMYITTENLTPITSTDTYINAQYWIDNLGNNDFYSIGSDTTQLSLQIRGRGNYTWTSFDKKPYRIKLTEKAPLLGLSKSKHFALLAHADDNLAFLRNTVGFELSRRLGLKYTPAQQPVEVVLNNDYIGLYFLTETIRVAKNRVNITEQPDNITHPDSISGGWLIEIDNYDEEQQLRITEKNGEIIRFTFQSPEILSNEQNKRFVIDLGRQTVGIPCLELYSNLEQKIIFSWGESLNAGRVERIIGARDFSFDYIAKAGENEYINYMFRLGCRYLEVECEQPIELKYAGVIPQVYPVIEKRAVLENEFDQRIYDICLRTMQLCMMERYVDCPWREQCLYAFDSRNQMFFGYYAYENGNAEYAKSNLLLISKDKRPDGLLSICFPCSMDLTIPSFSLHYILAVKEYVEYTGDITIIGEVYEKIDNLLNVFLKQIREGGLACKFEEKQHWNFYDWSPHSEGGIMVIDEPIPDLLINSLLILALDAFDYLKSCLD